MKRPEQHDAEWLLSDPRTRKWMVQCSGCGRWGYRADAPKRFFGRYWLERGYDALDLDDRRLCEICRKALETEPPLLGQQ